MPRSFASELGVLLGFLRNLQKSNCPELNTTPGTYPFVLRLRLSSLYISLRHSPRCLPACLSHYHFPRYGKVRQVTRESSTQGSRAP